MSEINWLEELGWSQENVDDLRSTGYAYIKQGKYEIAAKFFKALVALQPENAYNRQTMGALYLQLNEPENAIVELKKALKIDSKHPPTLLNLCRAYLALGKIDEALKICQALKKSDMPSVSNMAKAYLLAYSKPKKTN